MKDVMNDQISKEMSDKYTEMCADIAEVFHKYEQDFESNRETEYWLNQALHYVSMRKRIGNRKL